MILVDFNSLDACEHFALEYYLATERDLGETALLLWRTEPTLMVGKYQNARLEINLPLARALGVKIVRRLSGGDLHRSRGLAVQLYRSRRRRGNPI